MSEDEDRYWPGKATRSGGAIRVAAGLGRWGRPGKIIAFACLVALLALFTFLVYFVVSSVHR